MGEIIFSLAISAHIGLPGHYNNIHPRITYVNDDIIAGVFINSQSQLGMFVGDVHQLKYGTLEVGLVSGYYNVPVAPMAKFNVNNFFVSPAYANSEIGLVAGYEVKF